MKPLPSAVLFFVVFLAAGLAWRWVEGGPVTTGELGARLLTAVVAAAIYGGVMRVMARGTNRPG